ncbi:O-antigen ligase family protein [Geomobilimonas luticola]|uniref:O-antigen ligase family protein n=1 Tax=Geomobilimonas luticola TaxID=1114878 RepID=A0ABS5SC36_9BACT|nr:O-antigen ligase family protein [Geomobilimonas luticola]MBT0652933.1 O-antigen ligase family protein [Geomobilimonas luticola]
MKALFPIIVIYSILFMAIGLKDIKRFLVLTGVLSLPLQIDYTIMNTLWADRGWSQGILLRLSDVSFIMLAVVIVWENMRKNNSLLLLPTRIFWPFVGFVMACLFSFVNSKSIIVSGYQVAMITKIFFLYCVVMYNYVIGEKEMRFAINCMVACMLIQSVIAIAQTYFLFNVGFLRTGPTVEEIIQLDSGMIRASGTTTHPNSLASFIVPILISYIAIYLGDKKSMYGTLIISLSLFALILTNSRGAWIGFSVGLVGMLYLLVHHKQIKTKQLMPVFVLVMIVFVATSPLIYERIVGDDHNSAMSRWPLIQLAVLMFKEHPFVGVGINTFMLTVKDYLPQSLSDIYLYSVHNQYLLVLSESGIFGLITFIWIMVSMQKGVTLNAGSGRTFARRLGIGTSMGFLAIALHMMVDIYVSEIALGTIMIMYSICSAGKKYGAMNHRIHVNSSLQKNCLRPNI